MPKIPSKALQYPMTRAMKLQQIRTMATRFLAEVHKAGGLKPIGPKLSPAQAAEMKKRWAGRKKFASMSEELAKLSQKTYDLPRSEYQVVKSVPTEGARARQTWRRLPPGARTAIGLGATGLGVYALHRLSQPSHEKKSGLPEALINIALPLSHSPGTQAALMGTAAALHKGKRLGLAAKAKIQQAVQKIKIRRAMRKKLPGG